MSAAAGTARPGIWTPAAMDAERGDRFAYPREILLPDGRRLYLYENPPFGWFAGVWERGIGGAWTAKGWADRAPTHQALWEKVKRRIPVGDPLLASTIDGTFAEGPEPGVKKLARRQPRPVGGPQRSPGEQWVNDARSATLKAARRKIAEWCEAESIPVVRDGARLLVELGPIAHAVTADWADAVVVATPETSIVSDTREFATAEGALSFLRARLALAKASTVPEGARAPAAISEPAMAEPPPGERDDTVHPTPYMTEENRRTWHRSWVRYLADERAATRSRRMTPARERAGAMVNVPPPDAPMLYYPDSVRWGEPHRVLATGQPATVGWGVATGAGRQRDPVPSRFVAFLWLMGCGARVIAKIAGLSKSAADRRLQEITAEGPPTGHVRVPAASIVEAWDPAGAAAERRERTDSERALPQRLAKAEQMARELAAAGRKPGQGL